MQVGAEVRVIKMITETGFAKWINGDRSSCTEWRGVNHKYKQYLIIRAILRKDSCRVVVALYLLQALAVNFFYVNFLATVSLFCDFSRFIGSYSAVK